VSFGTFAAEDLSCPHGHGVMPMLSNRHIYVCPECGWGVTGVEVFANEMRNLRNMIRDKAIGRQIIEKDDLRPVR
jgi:anaerobic ribonucleoside-triphosphate reductase